VTSAVKSEKSQAQLKFAPFWPCFS